MITAEMDGCDWMGSRIEANNSKILILINITEGVYILLLLISEISEIKI